MEVVKTPLFQNVNGTPRKVYFETDAASVQTSDGSTVENKLSSLSAAVSGQTKTYVVKDIAARDAITETKAGDQVWVKDATGDPTVKMGAAKYIYEGVDAGWVKTAEAESMDMVINWADVQGTDDVKSAMSKAHEHANKTDVLDKLGAADDRLTFNGADVGRKYAAYVTVSEDDPGFDEAVAALNLPDGAFFTVVTP